MDFEAQVKELNASLKGIGDQIKSQAEATEKQIKASGEMNTETRAKVDELLTKQGEWLPIPATKGALVSLH